MTLNCSMFNEYNEATVLCYEKSLKTVCRRVNRETANLSKTLNRIITCTVLKQKTHRGT